MRVREARAAALAAIREARAGDGPDARTFPIEDWRLVSRRFSVDQLGQAETVFSVANGYLGLRATHDEGMPVHDPGAFVNGF